MSEESKKRRRVEGKVVSSKMEKTVTVQVLRRVLHPVYRKYVTRRKNYKVHDELNSACVNDTVVIEESRPLSKTKRWVLVEKR